MKFKTAQEARNLAGKMKPEWVKRAWMLKVLSAVEDAVWVGQTSVGYTMVGAVAESVVQAVKTQLEELGFSVRLKTGPGNVLVVDWVAAVE